MVYKFLFRLYSLLCFSIGLYQHVKERLRMGLFPFRITKDIKKFPTQPGWIELGILWE